MQDELLTRDEFRDTVFRRDNYKCVICGDKANASHHIVERRLWDDFGYYISNGASLCGACHIKAEQTTLSCEEIRDAAGIDKVILPEHLYDDERYDKWGNAFLPSGQRIRGELFNDESVQKILAQGGVLGDFTKYVKHPRTFHLPQSENLTSDDKMIEDTRQFDDKRVIISTKMDGEQMTWYSDYMHARSIDSRFHKSRTFVQNMHSQIAYLIPEGWRVCGENCYAAHSINYKNLKSYFYIHSIWNEKNVCLSYDETKEWCELLNLVLVDTLYDGMFTNKAINDTIKQLNTTSDEGFVVRNADAFPYSAFRKNVAKWVRKNHVHTHAHWMQQEIVKNELRKEE